MSNCLRNIVQVLFVVLVLFSFSTSSAYARRGVLPGRAEGVVSSDVSNTTAEQVVAGVKKVFGDDGFKVASENQDGIIFERPARLGKDVAYGGIVNEGGTWERVEVLISDEGSGNFHMECNPIMVTDKDQGVFEDQTEVLKLFAGEYRRLMRQVDREIRRN